MVNLQAGVLSVNRRRDANGRKQRD